MCPRIAFSGAAALRCHKVCTASAIEARRVKTRFLRGLIHESAVRVPTRRRPTTPTADVLPQANGRGSQSRDGTARLWNQAMPMS